MVTIKNLTDCTMTEIIKAWNDGFEGYSLNIKMTIPQFLERLVKEDLSPELSIVAFLEGQKEKRLPGMEEQESRRAIEEKALENC